MRARKLVAVSVEDTACELQDALDDLSIMSAVRADAVTRRITLEPMTATDAARLRAALVNGHNARVT